jgi:hypothetical protein
VAKEIMSYVNKIQTTVKIDNYHTIWRIKSALVAGNEVEGGL